MTASERAPDAAGDMSERIRDAVDDIKPKLRGWLHAGVVPLSLAAGIVLVVLSPNDTVRVGSAIFMITSLLLFTVSAVYHTGTWSPRTKDVLKRLDHANIFLLIAGSYTPFTLLLLNDHNAEILLTLVWVGALIGVAFRVLWVGAPRWLYVPVYVALGWAALFWMGDFARRASVAVLVLMIVGGALYSLGGLVYGIKRPNPAPRWFGFHEVFHSLTIVAFVSHYIGISIATYTLR
ncbi:MAG: PAQR family membrane homeostasis protein TrhA [Nocardioidaceae bacterium]